MEGRAKNVTFKELSWAILIHILAFLFIMEWLGRAAGWWTI
jgi:hypothetical protein